MKNKLLTWFLLLGALVFAFGLLVPALHAQAAAAPAVVAPAGVPFYASGDFWSALFGLVAGITAIWKHTELSTTKRALQAVVLGVETATKIPEVAAAETKVKAIIQDKAAQLGIQPILDRVVQDLTATH